MRSTLLGLLILCLVGCGPNASPDRTGSFYNALVLCADGVVPPPGPKPPSPTPEPPMECLCGGTGKSGDGLGPCACPDTCKCKKQGAPVTTGPTPVTDDPTRVIMFTGEWCGPCKSMKPTLDSLGVSVGKGKGKTIRQVYVNAEGVPEDAQDAALLKKYQPTVYPTFIYQTPTGTVKSEGTQSKAALQSYLGRMKTSKAQGLQ